MKELFRTLQIISEEELDRLDVVITTRTLIKGDFLIQEGKVCNEIVFIRLGALRSFYINNDGEELTNCITFERELMSAFSSFITQ